MHSATAATTPTTMPTILPVLLLLPAHRLSGLAACKSGTGAEALAQHRASMLDRLTALIVPHLLCNVQHNAGCNGLALSSCTLGLEAGLFTVQGRDP